MGADTTQVPLINSILEEATAEAERLVGEATRSVAERKASLDARLSRLERETDERIAAERDRITARADSRVALAESRARLAKESQVYASVLAGLRDAMRRRRADPDYPSLIRDWIVEAVMGIGAEGVVVSAPPADRDAVERSLDAARKALAENGAATVTLRFDSERAEAGQGIVVRDEGGRLAYSNLVDDRIRRYAAEIRRIVYRTVVEGHDA